MSWAPAYLVQSKGLGMAVLTIYGYSMRGFVCYKQTRRAVSLPTMYSWIYLGVSCMPPMWASSGNICSLAFGWKIALVFLFMNYMLISPGCRDGWSRSMSVVSQLLRGRTSCSVISKDATRWRLSAKSYPMYFACREYPGLVQQSKSLQSLGGALLFRSLSWRPNPTLDGITLDMLRSMQEGRTIRAFMARTFSVNTPPEPSGLPRPDVALVWRNWKSHFR